MRGIRTDVAAAEKQLKQFRQVALGAIAALGVRQLGRIANEFANIQNQLRTITDDETDLAVTSNEVLRIARETGASYAAQAELTARIARGNEQIGASGAEILKVSEAVTQTLAISGASQQETLSTVRQLGQALGSGNLQGEELRAILENNSVLARVIADEFGVGVGELRQLAKEGQITSERVFAAILNDAENINERFQEFAPTLERGGTAIRNSLVNAVGQVDAALGTTEAFARALLAAAEIIDEDLVPALTEGAGQLRSFTAVSLAEIALLANTVEQAYSSAAVAIAEARDENSTLDEAISALGESAAVFGDQFEGLPAGLREAVQVLVSPLQLVADGIATVNDATEDATEATADLTAAELERVTILQTIEDLERKAAEAAELRAKAREERAARLKALQLGPEGGAGVGDDLTKEQENAAKAAEKLVAALKEENAELIANAVFGDEAANVLQRRAALEIAATDGAQQFSDAIREQLDLLDESRRREEEAQNLRDDTQLIADLTEELRLITLTNEQRAVQLALADLSADATDKQRESVAALAAEIFNAGEETKGLTEFFTETLAEQTAIGIRGALRATFQGEFDDIKGDFGQFLSDLGQELLTSLFLQLLSNTFTDLAGPGGGGIFGALGQAFGGNRQFGGNAIGGRPNIVNESRGDGEIFMPPAGGGRIFPDETSARLQPQGAPQITIINSNDPANDLAAQETAAGREVARNNVTKDREFYQSFFGV